MREGLDESVTGVVVGCVVETGETGDVSTWVTGRATHG